ncbi:high mobility group box domain-containing protein, partial [Armillaria fumosa]
NHIPRPLNCYFIFCKDVVDKKMIPKGAKHDSHHLSRIIRQLWKNLSDDEKAHYYHWALEERKRHEELYPDYIYQP